MKNPLGQQVSYPSSYTPKLLYPISREDYRRELLTEADSSVSAAALSSAISLGYDIWRCYEFSWLQPSRPPGIAMLQLSVPACSPAIVESKSLKLYLGSFAQTELSSDEEVKAVVTEDISRLVGTPVIVDLLLPSQWHRVAPAMQAQGECLDDLPTRCTVFQPTPSLLRLDPATAKHREPQTLFSHLFRTLCPVTQQPDWATVEISYTGTPIDPGSVLQYLVSYREHQGFHEACCERLFRDITSICGPDSLRVICHFTRRGGIDITPVRFSSQCHLRPLQDSISRTLRQ